MSIWFYRHQYNTVFIVQDMCKKLEKFYITKMKLKHPEKDAWMQCSWIPSFFSWLGATFMLSSPRLLWVFTCEISTQTLAKKYGKNINTSMKLIAYAQVWSGFSLGRTHTIFLSLQHKHARFNLFSFFGDFGLGAGGVGWGGGILKSSILQMKMRC